MTFGSSHLTSFFGWHQIDGNYQKNRNCTLNKKSTKASQKIRDQSGNSKSKKQSTNLHGDLPENVPMFQLGFSVLDYISLSSVLIPPKTSHDIFLSNQIIPNAWNFPVLISPPPTPRIYTHCFSIPSTLNRFVASFFGTSQKPQ